MEFIVKEVAVESILPIRSAELLKGKDPEQCRLPEDNTQDAVHLGLFNEGKIIGCLSVFSKSNSEFEAENQYQYRGMAVTKEYQGNAIGNLLLNKADQILLERESRFVWLNARVRALSFYRRNGYNVVGGSFDVPGIGEHYLMYKRL